MDLISVIVPVYNVEKYLDRCVQSIVDQTYRNLEIILVDDGSPDNCGAMCDAWAAKDNRIKVIHKENGGSAQARNAGLDYATGQYIGFVDSDDRIHPEMYRHLYAVLTENSCDIAECGFCSFTSDDDCSETGVVDSVTVFHTKDALRENIKDRVCRQLLWNKLYKRNTIGDLQMTEGKTIDDEFFTYRVLANAKKVAVCSRVLYFYRQQTASIMHQKYTLKWLQAIEAKQKRLDLIRMRFPELTGDAGINLLFTCIYHGQLAQKNLPSAERKQAFHFLNNAVAGIPDLPKTDLKQLSFTHRCWLRLAQVNLPLTCRIRNLLSIGM